MSAVFETEEEAQKQYARLRRDVGANADLLTDSIAEAYFVESLEDYPNDTRKMIANARVIALTGIRANSAMLGKYAQNQSEEDLTKVFDNLTIMLNEAIEKVGRVQDDPEVTSSPFFFGRAPGYRGR